MIKSTYKYIILYILFIFSELLLIFSVDNISEENVKVQKNILIKQAQTYFQDQINTRKWNASYGGIYVKPKDTQEPNPYLKNNTLKVDDNLTLLKINPAWMTRQLSEQLKSKDFHFRITSLNPINPNNKATVFEKKALEYIEQNNINEYYELNEEDKKFNFMGALVTTKECLPCHKHQGYKLGDIRGGISVSLDSREYMRISTDMKDRAFVIKLLVSFFLVSITILIHKQFTNTKKLEKEVIKRTKEIESTKQILQKTLDADLSMLLLRDDESIIFINKTMLDFTGYATLEKFRKSYQCICDMFEDVDDKNFLKKYIDGVYWIDFLKAEQENKKLKVLIKKDSEDRYFKLNLKEIETNEKTLYLIIFNDITDSFTHIKQLKEQASTDSLTRLFNRSKFDEVLADEIELSNDTSSSLCVIFADIDFFKKINDEFGHSIGDEVLKEFAQILRESIRINDFIARWGGEEFIITLQSTSKEQAEFIAQKIRQKVENHTFKHVGKRTISLGVTQYIANESFESFIKRSDNALYKAQENGRNRVEVL